jgi:arsenite transporter
VPVMLSAVGVVNRTRNWYEQREGVVSYEECCPPGVHQHTGR